MNPNIRSKGGGAGNAKIVRGSAGSKLAGSNKNVFSFMSREEFVKDLTILPAKMSDADRKILESWGFVFHELLPHNQRIRKTTFPNDKWTKRQIRDRSSDIELIDPDGKCRADIHYFPKGNRADATLKVKDGF